MLSVRRPASAWAGTHAGMGVVAGVSGRGSILVSRSISRPSLRATKDLADSGINVFDGSSRVPRGSFYNICCEAKQ